MLSDEAVAEHQRIAVVDACDRLLMAIDEESARVAGSEQGGTLTFNSGVAEGLQRAALIVRGTRSAAHREKI